jgi:N-methylhydantoinase A/oxoprolinase/acetone carboxylase beta subunit
LGDDLDAEALMTPFSWASTPAAPSPNSSSWKEGARNKGREPKPRDWREAFFEGGRVRMAFYLRSTLEAGDALEGPAVLLQEDATTVVPPGWRARVDEGGNLVVEQGLVHP